MFSESGDAIPGATVVVDRRDHAVLSAGEGDYWRLLVPGRYVLWVTGPGHRTTSETVTVGEGAPTVVNFTLVKCEEGEKGCGLIGGGSQLMGSCPLLLVVMGVACAIMQVS